MNPFQLVSRQDKKLKYKVASNYEKNKVGQYVKKDIDIEAEDKVSLYNLPSLYEILLKLDAKGNKPTTPNALKLYLYIVFKLKKNQEKVTLVEERVNLEIGMGASGFYNAKNELLRIGLICMDNGRRRGTDYWVNTDYLFQGKKIDLFKTEYPDRTQFVGKF